MKVPSLLCIALWLSCATAPRSQTPGGEVGDFFLDPAGKSYFLLADSRLLTDNPLGGNRYSFFDSSLGMPDYVDVTDPFQILVYYREYGTVLVLDRTLNELSRVDLLDSPHLEQPGALARSYAGGIWAFDEWAYRLLELDRRGEVAQRTNDLRLELGSRAAEPPTAVLVGRNRVMLLFDREEGGHWMAVFTNYGDFERWVALPPAARLSWYAPHLLGLNETTGYLWSAQQPETVVPLDELPSNLPARGRVYAASGRLLWANPRQLVIGGEGLPDKK